jgi:hypothetical protein
MSESDSEPGITDDDLPDDLVGDEDNPLAQEAEEQPDFDVLEGKDAEESGESASSDSASDDAAEDTAE